MVRLWALLALLLAGLFCEILASDIIANSGEGPRKRVFTGNSRLFLQIHKYEQESTNSTK